MPHRMVTENPETKLIAEIERLGADERWRVAILHGSQMDAVQQRTMRFREGQLGLLQVDAVLSVTIYSCDDRDIVFLFRETFESFWPVLEKMVRTLLPFVDVQQLADTDLVTFHTLAGSYDNVLARIRAKLEPADRGLKRTHTQLHEKRWYVWNNRLFADAVKRRGLRTEKLAAIVEDDKTLRQMAREVLRPYYAILSAADGHEALALYNQYAPDLMFLDITLPHIDGMHVLTTIMEHDPAACIVMFTAHNRQEVIDQALESGAKGFVMKPFTAATLLQHARQAMRQIIH